MRSLRATASATVWKCGRESVTRRCRSSASSAPSTNRTLLRGDNQGETRKIFDDGRPFGRAIRFRHDPASLNLFVTQALAELGEEGRIQAIMEPTGMSWFPVAHRLADAIWGRSLIYASARMGWGFRCSMPPMTKSPRTSRPRYSCANGRPIRPLPVRWASGKARFPTARSAKFWALRNNTTGANTSLAPDTRRDWALIAGSRRVSRQNVMAPLTKRRTEYSPVVAQINRRSRRGPPKQRLATTSGISILPISVPSGS